MSALEAYDILFLSTFGNDQKFGLFCISRNPTHGQLIKCEGVCAREFKILMQTEVGRNYCVLPIMTFPYGMAILMSGIFAFTTTEEAAIYYLRDHRAPRNA